MSALNSRSGTYLVLFLLPSLMFLPSTRLSGIQASTRPVGVAPMLNSEGEFLLKHQGNMLLAASLIIVVFFIMLYFIWRLNRMLKKNEANLREVNRRIITAVNHTSNLILSLNHQGVIRLINQAAIDFYQKWIGVELTAGIPIIEACENTRAGEQWKAWLKSSRITDSWTEVIETESAETTRYYRLNFSRISRPDGEYTGLVMMGADITTEHLYQQELSVEHQALKQSNSAKEKMMSIMAHDLKDAISSAMSISKMVNDEPEDFDREHLLQIMFLLYGNFEKTQNLLDGILNWIKTQTSSLAARIECIHLHELIEEVRQASAEKIKRKNIRVENGVPPDLHLKADREMIRIVLRNLLSNALKFTYKGKGVIKIETRVNADYATIHVKDNGVGMTEKVLSSLQNNNHRFSLEGTDNEMGNGMGLFLCQELLKINQSSLEVHSVKGKGSDFYFSLPLNN